MNREDAFERLAIATAIRELLSMNGIPAGAMRPASSPVSTMTTFPPFIAWPWSVIRETKRRIRAHCRLSQFRREELCRRMPDKALNRSVAEKIFTLGGDGQAAAMQRSRRSRM